MGSSASWRRTIEVTMSIQTVLTQRLRLRYPIIQAPLAGGADTPQLVAAVCNGGGIGFIGAAYSTPEQILQLAAAVRSQTQQPFGINLFAPLPAAEMPSDFSAALQWVAPYYAELGLPAPTAPPVPPSRFSDQLTACLESGAAAFSFTFGCPSPEAIAAIKQHGMFLIGTATTVDEAVILEKAGVDAIVAQGSEAGGHRGTFNGTFEAGMIGTISLVPQIVDAVTVPVIASGGIMDGRGIAAALALGASAMQLGTAFLTGNEAGTPPCYKRAILAASEDQTRITRAFSGRPARGIVNRFMTEVEFNETDDAILPFPLQNSLTRPLRTEAAKQGRPEFLSLWSGQGVRLARRQPAAQLVARLAKEIDATIATLQKCRPE